MKLTPTEEMEQRIRMRYAFALSSFSRMFDPGRLTPEMRQLCDRWARDIEEVPTEWDLYQVDRYFLEIWKERNNSQDTLTQDQEGPHTQN